MQKWIESIIVLFGICMAITISAIFIYQREYAGALEAKEKAGLYMKAERIYEVPDKYLNITQVDFYVLYAIANEGKPIYVGSHLKTTWENLTGSFGPYPVKADDKFYMISLSSLDFWSYPDPFLYAAGIVIVWIIFAITEKRKASRMKAHQLSKHNINTK